MKAATLNALLLIGIAAPLASGSTVLVTSRGGLTASDSLSWSAFGGEGTTVASGSVAVTVGGNSVTVSGTGSNGFSLLQQGSAWSGNFANNDLLLWTGNINTFSLDSGPVSLMFASLVQGAGFQIQPDNGLGFTASIDVFDSSNTNIGSFVENGTSSSAGDNSAIFLGVLSTAGDIRRIAVNITSPSGIDFAINQVTIQNAAAGVPEPGSIGLVLVGAGLLPVLGRRRAADKR